MFLNSMPGRTRILARIASLAGLSYVLVLCGTSRANVGALAHSQERCILIITDDDIPSGSATAGAMFVEDAEEGRTLLTADVAAAAEGFLAGGSTCVDIVDSHDGAIDPRPFSGTEIRVLTPSNTEGWTWPFLGPMDRSYEAAALVGFHTNAGETGFRAHTINDDVRLLKIDGASVGEVTHLTIGLSAFDVPVVLVTGDMNATAEARARNPDVQTITVRWIESDGSTGFLANHEATRVIMEAAKRAASKDHRITSPEPPFDVEIHVYSEMLFEERQQSLVSSYRAHLQRRREFLLQHPLGRIFLESKTLTEQPRTSARGLAWQADSALSAFMSIAFVASHFESTIDNWEHVSEGYDAYRQGDLESAIDHYHSALKITPHDLDTRCRLAAAYQQRGRSEEALEHYAFGFEHLDELRTPAMKRWCLKGLTEVALELGRFDDARRAVLQLCALAEDPDSTTEVRWLLELLSTETIHSDESPLQSAIPIELLTPTYLDSLGISVDSSGILRAHSHVAKMVVFKGMATEPQADVLAKTQVVCGTPRARMFNELACDALEQRQCALDECSYAEFTHCTGTLVDSDLLVASADCAASISGHDGGEIRSRIYRFVWDGSTWSTSEHAVLETISLDDGQAEGLQFRRPPSTGLVELALVQFDPTCERTSRATGLSEPHAGEPLVLFGFSSQGTRPSGSANSHSSEDTFGGLMVSFRRPDFTTLDCWRDTEFGQNVASRSSETRSLSPPVDMGSTIGSEHRTRERSLSDRFGPIEVNLEEAVFNVRGDLMGIIVCSSSTDPASESPVDSAAWFVEITSILDAARSRGALP